MNGQWLIASDIATSDRPVPAPPPPTPTPAPMPMVEMDQADMMAAAAAGLQWSDLKLPGLAPGARMTVVHGDPSKSDDYTIRLRFPNGYVIPPHWHPGGEHVTVLTGNLSLGMGETLNRSSVTAYGVGDFFYVPSKMAHYAIAKGETIVQLHGTGPFALNLVNK